MTTTQTPNGILTNYYTGEAIRPATPSEEQASKDAALQDSGAGVIEVDGVRCFVA